MSDELTTVKWAKLHEILDGMISGELNLTEGCREVFVIGHELNQSGNPLFSPFQGFYSEVDAFPIGEVRKLWAADALIIMDQKRTMTEQHYKDWIIDAANKFRRFVTTKLNQ
jgi:hypothetical protein